MPFAGFKDFDDCVKFQISKGETKLSAQKICGVIQKKSERVNMKIVKDIKRAKEKKKDWRKISFNAPITEAYRIGEGAQSKFIIKGVAINETTTRNGITYMAAELEKAAFTLRKKPILKDHEALIDNIVGKTTENVHFDKETKSLKFEGRIENPKIQEMISQGLIDNVSIGGSVNEWEETEDAKIAKGIEFLELSLVAIPGDPNASFSKAMFESYKLKEADEDDEEAQAEEKEEKEAKKEEEKYSTETKRIVSNINIRLKGG